MFHWPDRPGGWRHVFIGDASALVDFADSVFNRRLAYLEVAYAAVPGELSDHLGGRGACAIETEGQPAAFACGDVHIRDGDVVPFLVNRDLVAAPAGTDDDRHVRPVFGRDSSLRSE